MNGKAVKDRKQIIPEFHIDYSVSLERLRNPTLYAKQKKALHDKTKGICVCCYDKKTEVETNIFWTFTTIRSLYIDLKFT